MGSERQGYEAQAAPREGSGFASDRDTAGVQFVDVAKQAGLNVKTIYGGERRNEYCSKPLVAAQPSSTTTRMIG